MTTEPTPTSDSQRESIDEDYAYQWNARMLVDVHDDDRPCYPCLVALADVSPSQRSPLDVEVCADGRSPTAVVDRRSVSLFGETESVVGTHRDIFAGGRVSEPSLLAGYEGWNCDKRAYVVVVGRWVK